MGKITKTLLLTIVLSSCSPSIMLADASVPVDELDCKSCCDAVKKDFISGFKDKECDKGCKITDGEVDECNNEFCVLGFQFVDTGGGLFEESEDRNWEFQCNVGGELVALQTAPPTVPPPEPIIDNQLLLAAIIGGTLGGTILVSMSVIFIIRRRSKRVNLDAEPPVSTHSWLSRFSFGGNNRDTIYQPGGRNTSNWMSFRSLLPSVPRISAMAALPERKNHPTTDWDHSNPFRSDLPPAQSRPETPSQKYDF